MTLCPTCNNTLDRKHSEELGEDVIRCRVCKTFTVEGVSGCLVVPSIGDLRRMAQQRDDDKRRQKEMIESPISDPRWTQIYI